jgi:hypothetical protein
MAKPRKQKRRVAPGSRRAAGQKTGAVTSKSELGIQVTDFFDYEYGPTGSATEGNVKHYYWSVNQNLFNNNTTGTSGQENSFCRVRKVEVYVLPRRNINPIQTDPAFNSNASAMYTVNVQTPSLAGYSRPTAGTSIALATNNQVTNILPQVDTFWKKVYGCDLQKTFQSSVIRPYYYGNLQCLFSLRLLDPTDGLDYAGVGNEAFKVRVKVVLHIDQPIMPVQRATFTVLSNNDVGQPDVDAASGAGPAARPEYCQMDLKSVRHCMR